MSSPRPSVLNLEEFEDRALPSGGFHHHAPDARGWDATPAITRELHSESEGQNHGPGQHGADFFRGDDRSAVARDHGTHAAAPEVVTVRVVTARSQNVSVRDDTAANAREVESAEGPAALPPDATDTRDVPTSAVRAPAGEPSAAPVPSVRPVAPSHALPVTAPGSAVWGNVTGEPAPGAGGPVASVPEVPVAPAPRTPDFFPFPDWKPIAVELPGVPVVGAMGVDVAALETGIQNLLDLAGGVDVSGAEGNGWRVWLAAGAALGGAAGYAAWVSRGGRSNRLAAPGWGGRA